MSNIEMNRVELERIFSTFNIVFLNIQKEAAKFGVDLSVYITEGGTVSLTASDYSDDEVIKCYEISQNEVDTTYQERRFKRNTN